jgi:hypothetical protein
MKYVALCLGRILSAVPLYIVAGNYLYCVSLGVLVQVTKKNAILRAVTLCSMVNRQHISEEHLLLPFWGKRHEDRGTRFLLNVHAYLSNYTT